MEINENLQMFIENYVKKSLHGENLQDIVVKIKNTAPNEGYNADNFYITVTGTSKSKGLSTYDLFLKKSQDDPFFKFTENLHIREIYMYQTVLPYYEKFQTEKQLGTIDYLPKCYSTFKDGKLNIILLQNFKKLNYELHSRYETMNFDHIACILRAFAEWHALSFAIRDQKYGDYKKLCEGFQADGWSDVLDEAKQFLKLISQSFKITKEILREHKDFDLANELEKVTPNNCEEYFATLLKLREDKNVIIHGDSWNNNFLFLYGNGKISPTDLKIIDWQLSHPRSVVFDLSHMIYSLSSEKEMAQFDTLIKIYHETFSNHLKKLGSDPKTLFTFSELLNHWKKYSAFGLCMGIFLVVSNSASNVPAYSDDNFEENLTKIELTKPNEFYNRVKAMVGHYVSFQK